MKWKSAAWAAAGAVAFLAALFLSPYVTPRDAAPAADLVQFDVNPMDAATPISDAELMAEVEANEADRIDELEQRIDDLEQTLRDTAETADDASREAYEATREALEAQRQTSSHAITEH